MREQIQTDIDQAFELKKGVEYVFPSFTFVYAGDKLTYMKDFVHKYFHYDFFIIIPNQGAAFELQWSSGTGLLTPLEFSLNKDTYYCEPWKKEAFSIKKK